MSKTAFQRGVWLVMNFNADSGADGVVAVFRIQRMRISEVSCVEMMMEISDEQAIESFECL